MLGGTRFIGLHMTALALQRGHTLTFFNRGKTKADRYPEVERIKGDRNGEIDGLKDREWDVVIDNSGYVPRHVRLSAELLAPKVRQYVFTSSISVYPNFSVPRDEKSPVGKLRRRNRRESRRRHLWAAEGAVRAGGGEGAARPHHHHSPRAHRRSRRQHRPLHLLAGARRARRRVHRARRAADPFQIIDARDLAAFTLNVVEKNITGTYNLVSNVNGFRFGELTDACIAAANKQAKPADAPRATWIPAEFLEEQKVEPWSEMPVWLPAKGDEAAFAGTSNAAAVAQGLKISPLKKTVDDTLAWHLTRPAEEREKLKAGIAPDKEATVLAAWKVRGKA